jgi:hypothetical protein
MIKTGLFGVRFFVAILSYGGICFRVSVQKPCFHKFSSPQDGSDLLILTW